MKYSQTADLEKWDSRKKGLTARRNLSREQNRLYSDELVKRVLALDEVAKATSVFCYVAMPDEVQTLELMEKLLQAGKVVSIPLIRCRGKMEAAEVASIDSLVPGKYGILTIEEGKEVLVDPKTIDCAIVPGSAFGRNGSRVGLGGGFYDRYLLKTPKAKRIGVCFDCQLSDEVPVERHDIFMNMVITEKDNITV